jgi:uncharacterized protein YwgA
VKGLAPRDSYLVGLLNELGYAPRDITSDDAFNDRLRVQKAVFLLNYLGVAPFTGYRFSMYLRGPYSPQLAHDYYHLGDVEPEALPVDPRGRDLLAWFMGHENSWLEVASSILSIRRRHPQIDRAEIYPILRMSKPWVKDDLYQLVITHLDSKGL